MGGRGDVILTVGKARVGIEAGTEFHVGLLPPLARRNDVNRPRGLPGVVQDPGRKLVGTLDHAADRSALVAAFGKIQPVARHSRGGRCHETARHGRGDARGERPDPVRRIVANRSEVKPKRGETAEAINRREGEFLRRLNRDTSRTEGADPESVVRAQLLRGLGFHKVLKASSAPQMDAQRTIRREGCLQVEGGGLFAAGDAGLHLLLGQPRQHTLARQRQGCGSAHLLQRAAEVPRLAFLAAVLERGEDFLLSLFPCTDLGQGGRGVAADFFLGIGKQVDQPTAHGLLFLRGAEASEGGADRANHGDPLHALAR